jgi:hypothetical protein
LSTGGKGCVDAGPCPDEKRADDDDQHGEPVPTVCVKENVEISDKDRNGSDNDTHSLQFTEVHSTLSHEVGWREKEIDAEECNSGLVDAIDHISPGEVSII